MENEMFAQRCFQFETQTGTQFTGTWSAYAVVTVGLAQGPQAKSRTFADTLSRWLSL